MSQFEGVIPEPEKKFLIQILDVDELSFHYLREGEYTKSIICMYGLLLRLYKLLGSRDTDRLITKFEAWMARADYRIPDVWQARKEMSGTLSDKIYSKMNLGIIPTGALPSDEKKPKPEDKPMREDLSSKI